jgi:tetratricopeptide (TPR) repeat protein
VNLEVERLLELASALPPDRRAEFLAGECSDSQVREEVLSLLDYAAGAETFFEQAIQGVAASVSRGREFEPGDPFGPYRIVSLLGRGGMGSVYLAERVDGEVQQKVAIKLLRADCYRPEWRSRFLLERQLLASLHHPSIVHLIDAGHTEEGGRPFLVMEYVEGLPIDVYAIGIPMREKLKLFLRVCDAVAHAHRRLVIHRDLKPSNILVDASGQPKLLDFGIAKLVNNTGDTTGTVERMLTPKYASPEQLAGEVQGTATDIYSLGVVLFELITRGAQLRPGTGPTTRPSRLNPESPRDLDFIVEKALRPEPEDRYLSVDDLAADVRAALDWRPVRARSADRWYRTRRFLRRYWPPLAAAVVAIGSLSAALYAVNRQRVVAERRLTEVHRLADKLFDIDAQVAQLPGGARTRQLIVETALDYLRRMSVEAPLDSTLALDIGTAYMRVGRVLGVNIAPNLGKTEQADEAAAHAEALIDSVLAGHPEDGTALLRAAQIAHDRMILAGDRRRDADAMKYARKSQARLNEFLHGTALSEKSDRADSQQVIISFINIANRYVLARELDDAVQACNRAIEIARATGWPAQAGAAEMVLAMARREQGDLDDALRAARDSARVLEPRPEDNDSRRSTYTLALIRQGQILGDVDSLSLGRTNEAAEVLESAVQIARELADHDANDFSRQSRMVFAETTLASTLRHTDPRHSLELYDDAARRLAGVRHNAGTPRREITVLAGSVDPLLRLGRRAEARKRLDAAFALLNEQHLYPAAEIELGGEADRALRARANYEGTAGNALRGAEICEEIVRSVRPVKSLSDAQALSSLYASAAEFWRRAGEHKRPAELTARSVELWRSWSARLPHSAFVHQQLEAASPF